MTTIPTNPTNEELREFLSGWILAEENEVEVVKPRKAPNSERRLRLWYALLALLDSAPPTSKPKVTMEELRFAIGGPVVWSDLTEKLSGADIRPLLEHVVKSAADYLRRSGVEVTGEEGRS